MAARMWGGRWNPGTRTARLHWALLILGAVGALQIEVSSPVNVVLGNETVLSVRLSGGTNPRVTWMRGGRLVAYWQVGDAIPEVNPEFRDRLDVNTSGASITFNRTERSDAGTYQVTLETFNQEPVSGSIELRVYELIRGVGVSLPMGVVVEGNSTVTLSCTQDTGNWNSLNWSKDGSPVPNDSHFLQTGAELTIREVVRTDAGVYSCSLENPFSKGSAQAQLTVYYGPDVPVVTISSPLGSGSSQFVLVNNTVNLTCSTSSEPPAQYFWSVGDNQDSTVPSQPVLSLRQIQLAQAGAYTCIVVNSKITRSVRQSVTLNVYELPVGNPTCWMMPVEIEALTFSCAWRGGSPLAQLRWDGLARNMSAEEQLQETDTSPRRLDGKNVTCVAQHPARNVSCVLSPVSPRLDLSRVVSTDARGRATISLTCLSRADPPADILWYKGQGSLPNSGNVETRPGASHLRIRDFSLANDTGNYSCAAGNPVGSSSQSLQLTAPLVSGVSVRRLNGSAATVSWAVRPFDVVTSFWVQSLGGVARSGSWQTLAVAGMTERQATVSGLREDRRYSLRVLPMVGLQEGAASATTSVDPTISPTLSPGAIIGIVVGCAVGVFLIVLIILFILWRKFRRKQNSEPRKQAVNGELNGTVTGAVNGAVNRTQTTFGDSRPGAAPARIPSRDQPFTLYQPDPQGSRTAPSVYNTMSQNGRQNSVSGKYPDGVHASMDSLPRWDTSSQLTPTSTVKPISTHTLQRRKATMV